MSQLRFFMIITFMCTICVKIYQKIEPSNGSLVWKVDLRKKYKWRASLVLLMEELLNES